MIFSDFTLLSFESSVLFVRVYFVYNPSCSVCLAAFFVVVFWFDMYNKIYKKLLNNEVMIFQQS